MGLLVVKPGLATTVQDLGRPGYRGFGVPVGGAFDLGSLRLANALLGNDPTCAAIEMTMFGGQFQAIQLLALALAGAPFAVSLRRGDAVHELSIPQTFSMSGGDQIIFGGVALGLRAYLAVRGGWQTPVILGSRSCESRLQPDDIVPAGPGSVAVRRPSDGRIDDPTADPFRLIDGPDGAVPLQLLEHTYRMGGASDRVGLRLEGPSLAGLENPGKASAPVAPGAVQVAGGRPIILGVAGGTMGGYPHVAHVISADLDRLGQVRPGERIRFERVEWDQARCFDRERREHLAKRDRRIALRALDGDESG